MCEMRKFNLSSEALNYTLLIGENSLEVIVPERIWEGWGKIWPQKLEVITAKYSASDLQRHTVFGFYWIFLTEEGRRFSVNGLDWGLSGRMENMTLQTTHAEEMSDVLSIAKVRFESGLFLKEIISECIWHRLVRHFLAICVWFVSIFSI